jgi:hypothetical protein
MKTKIYSAALVAMLGISFISCKREDHDNDQYITCKDGIIGCTTNSNGVVAAIDPIMASEFAYTPTVCEGIVVGPSTISTDNLRYYFIAADHQLNEVNTSNGHLLRSFKLSTPYYFLVYDEAGKRLLGLSGNNELLEIDLQTGLENQLGTVLINDGVLSGTEFMRDGKLCLMGQNVLLTIDPSSLAVSKAYSFDMQYNSIGYDADKDKLFYISSPAGSKGISLFEFDFSNSKSKELRNYPDITSFVMHSTAYNEFTGQYHFYSSNSQRTSIDVNTLNYKVEKVDFHLLNTEVIRGRFKLPHTEIKG